MVQCVAVHRFLSAAGELNTGQNITELLLTFWNYVNI